MAENAEGQIRFPRMMDADVSAERGSTSCRWRSARKKTDAETKRRTWPVEGTGSRDIACSSDTKTKSRGGGGFSEKMDYTETSGKKQDFIVARVIARDASPARLAAGEMQFFTDAAMAEAYRKQGGERVEHARRRNKVVPGCASSSREKARRLSREREIGPLFDASLCIPLCRIIAAIFHSRCG